MVANVIAALLTTMLVEVNDPISRNFIEWGIFHGLMTSSGHAYLHRHMASLMAFDRRRRRFWSTFRVRSLVARGISLSWSIGEKGREGSFGNEFSSVCNHCGVMAAWSRKTWKKVHNFLRFLENDPLRENFRNSVPKRFIATPIEVLWANFVKFGRRKMGKIVRCLPDKKQNLAWFSRSRYCPDRTQNLQGPASPRQCAQRAPDFIQIGSLLAES